MAKKKPADSTMVEADQRTFEQVFAELESVVEELESGDLPLEQSLARFEVGLRDYRRCIDILEGVERRIEVLDQQAGGSPRPVEGYEDDAAGEKKDAQ